GSDQTAIRSTRKFSNSLLNVSCVSPPERAHLQSEHPRCRLNRSQLRNAARRGGVSNDSDMCHVRSNFLQQFHPFRPHSVVDSRKPGDVAARLRQTSDKATADGIGNLRKYDGHAPGRLLQCGDSWSAIGKDDVRRQCHQFCCSFPQIAGIPSILDLYITTCGPTQLLQFSKERRYACLPV